MQQIQTSQIAVAANPAALIDRVAFGRAVEIAAMAVQTRNTYPILANVRMTGDGQTLFVTGTDLDVEVVVACPAAADSRLDTTIPAGTLKTILKKAPASEYVSLECFEESARIEMEKVNYTLSSLAADGYPCLKWDEPSHAFEMSGADFYEALAAVKGAISTEETRYYLNGIYMHEIDGKLRTVTTDGHRLYRQDHNAPDGSKGMPGIIIPRLTVGHLLKLTKGKACPETVKIELSDVKIRFQFDDVTVTSKLIEGTFPDYHRVTPQNNHRLATFDANAMQEAIKAVSVIASERGGKAVKFEIGKGEIVLTVNNPDHGTSTSRIAATLHEIDEFEIGFNVRYLTELLAECAPSGGEITAKLNDSGSPTLFTGSRDNWLGVCMPMRV